MLTLTEDIQPRTLLIILPQHMVMDRRHYSSELEQFFEKAQREMIEDSFIILDHCENTPAAREVLRDFAFVVFPAGRAYEGFLKTYLYRAHLITKAHYLGKHFRIGRSLNPDLPLRFRDEQWIYDDVARMCSPEVARLLWDAWLRGRNHLFHYRPDERELLSLADARKRIELLIEAMEAAIRCDWHGQSDLVK